MDIVSPGTNRIADETKNIIPLRYYSKHAGTTQVRRYRLLLPPVPS